MHIRVRPTSKWRERVPMNPGCELVELRLLFTILPLVLRNMFHRGAAIHHLSVSDPTRVGDVTHIPCNAVPPDRGCPVNPTLKPVFWLAETGGRRAITGMAKFAKNHQILMGFWWQQIIMSILAECQPFACQWLGNVSKTTGPQAIGDGLVKQDHIHWWWIWSKYPLVVDMV
jgi:hypothetical protein